MSATAPKADQRLDAQPVISLRPGPGPFPAGDAQTNTGTPAASPSVSPAPRRRPLKKIIGFIVLLALAGLAGRYGYDWWTLGRFEISTDDAYVRAHISALSSRVPGYVAEMPFADNTPVKAGDVLLRLDDGDLKLNVEEVHGRLETQKAAIATIGQQIAAQESSIRLNKARLEQALAVEENSKASQQRTEQLVARQVESKQRQDDSAAAVRKASAAVEEAKAAIAGAEGQKAVLQANQAQAERQLAELETALAKAERNLGFAVIPAPFDGVVANRSVQIGQYVQPSQRLMALVPTDTKYIEANFKETDIANIHPGQKVHVVVDALGKKNSFESRVESLSPASGAEFSLLPPENATGNFTKITQRIPVRIVVPPEKAVSLELGLSVEVTLDRRDGGTP